MTHIAGENAVSNPTEKSDLNPPQPRSSSGVGAAPAMPTGVGPALTPPDPSSLPPPPPAFLPRPSAGLLAGAAARRSAMRDERADALSASVLAGLEATMARVERVASMERIALVQHVSLNGSDLTNGSLEEELAALTNSESAATAASGGIAESGVSTDGGLPRSASSSPAFSFDRMGRAPSISGLSTGGDRSSSLFGGARGGTTRGDALSLGDESGLGDVDGGPERSEPDAVEMVGSNLGLGGVGGLPRAAGGGVRSAAQDHSLTAMAGPCPLRAPEGELPTAGRDEATAGRLLERADAPLAAPGWEAGCSARDDTDETEDSTQAAGEEFEDSAAAGMTSDAGVASTAAELGAASTAVSAAGAGAASAAADLGVAVADLPPGLGAVSTPPTRAPEATDGPGPQGGADCIRRWRLLLVPTGTLSVRVVATTDDAARPGVEEGVTGRDGGTGHALPSQPDSTGPMAAVAGEASDDASVGAAQHGTAPAAASQAGAGPPALLPAEAARPGAKPAAGTGTAAVAAPGEGRSARGKRVYATEYLLSMRREQTWEELEEVPDWARDDTADSAGASGAHPASRQWRSPHAEDEAQAMALRVEEEVLGAHSAQAAGGGGDDLDSLVSTLSAQLSGAGGSAYLAGCSPVDLTAGPAIAEEEEDFEVVATTGGAGGGELGALLNSLSSQVRASGLTGHADAGTTAAIPPQPPVAFGLPIGARAEPGGLNAMLAALGAQLEQQRQLMQQQEALQQQLMQPAAAGVPPPPQTSWPPLQPVHAPQPRHELPPPPLPPGIPGVHPSAHLPPHAPPQPVAPLQTPSAIAATQHLSALLGIGGGLRSTAVGAQPAPAHPHLAPAPLLIGAAVPQPPRAWHGGGGHESAMTVHGTGRNEAQHNLDTFGGGDEALDLAVFSQQSAAFQQERGQAQLGRGAPKEGWPGQRAQRLPAAAEPCAPNWQQQLFGRQL